VAILGQITVFYAPTNAGKTLITMALLIEAFKEGRINPSNVIYINADDNYKGFVEKLKIAEKHGFYMLPPEGNGYKTTDTEAHLKRMVREGTAHNKVVILDTTKKFTNIMDKRIGSEFGKVARGFAMAGGSIILLSHTNKHLDAGGRPVPQGTADIPEDADCAYVLQAKPLGGGCYQVSFELRKSRGDVEDHVTYEYTKTKDRGYEALVDSVRRVDPKELKLVAEVNRAQALLTANQEAIDVLTEVIESGVTLKSQIVDEAVARSDVSRGKLRKALDDHCGTSWLYGHRWEMVIGEKNSHNYRLLPFLTSANGVPIKPAVAANTANTAVNLDGPQTETDECDESDLSEAAESANTAYTALYVGEPQTTQTGLSE